MPLTPDSAREILMADAKALPQLESERLETAKQELLATMRQGLAGGLRQMSLRVSDPCGFESQLTRWLANVVGDKERVTFNVGAYSCDKDYWRVTLPNEWFE